MSLAFLYPGQGSQQPGMLHSLPASAAVTATLEEAGDLDTAAALRDPADVQAALVIAGVAGARALKEDRGLSPAFVAGHSVGAFAAAVTAGVLTLREALVAVRLRGDLMRDACAGREWGMAAMTGLTIRAAQRVVDETTSVAEPLWLANVNGATQTVVSGTAAALRVAADAARRLGARSFERLDVPVASHCPLQQGTAERMADHLAGIPRRTPSTRYLTNTRGRCVSTADLILDDLAWAAAQPVQWHDATRLMAELGATCALQLPPGRILVQLMGSAMPAYAVSEVGLDGAVAAAGRSVPR